MIDEAELTDLDSDEQRRLLALTLQEIVNDPWNEPIRRAELVDILLDCIGENRLDDVDIEAIRNDAHEFVREHAVKSGSPDGDRFREYAAAVTPDDFEPSPELKRRVPDSR